MAPGQPRREPAKSTFQNWIMIVGHDKHDLYTSYPSLSITGHQKSVCHISVCGKWILGRLLIKCPTIPYATCIQVDEPIFKKVGFGKCFMMVLLGIVSDSVRNSSVWLAGRADRADRADRVLAKWRTEGYAT